MCKDQVGYFVFIPLGGSGEVNSQYVSFFSLQLRKVLPDAISLHGLLCKFAVSVDVTMTPSWPLLTTLLFVFRFGWMLVHRYFSLTRYALGAWQPWEVTTTIIITATGNNTFYALHLFPVMEVSTVLHSEVFPFSFNNSHEWLDSFFAEPETCNLFFQNSFPVFVFFSFPLIISDSSTATSHSVHTCSTVQYTKFHRCLCAIFNCIMFICSKKNSVKNS